MDFGFNFVTFTQFYGCWNTRTQATEMRMRFAFPVSIVAQLCAGGMALSERSRAGALPSSGDQFVCYGCVAAVKSAYVLLGREMANEDKVQELFEESAHVCAARNFEEVEQIAWNMPPPETSRACSTFVQVGSRQLHDQCVSHFPP